jgi:hypothetical protein
MYVFRQELSVEESKWSVINGCWQGCRALLFRSQQATALCEHEAPMRRPFTGVTIAIICFALADCSHAPVLPPAADIEAAYKTSYIPPAGYGRVYIFPINDRVLGRDHLKTTDIYIGDNKTFICQAKEGEFCAFDMTASQVPLLVQWANVKIIAQTVTIADGRAVFIKPNWDKRPGNYTSSPLMMFGAIGGVLAAATAEEPEPGLHDVVDAATAMSEIQSLHLASITTEARGLVRQEK